jgi:hypothetical protein
MNSLIRSASALLTFLGGLCVIVLGYKVYKNQQDSVEEEVGQTSLEPTSPNPKPVRKIVFNRRADWVQAKEEVTETLVKEPASRFIAEDLSIAGLGQQMRNAPDDESRKAAFHKMLRQLTVNNARQMRRQVADMDADSYEYREFHYQWGKIGGMDAVLHGQTTEKPDMRITLAGWASADPEAAMEWFNSLPEYDRKNFSNQVYMMSGLVHGLTDHSPERGLNYVLKLQEAKSSHAGRMMSVVTGRMIDAEGVQYVAEWTESLPEGALRAVARARLVWDMGKENLGATAAWVEGFANDPDAGPGVEAMAKVWAKQDIVGSVTWLESLDHGPAKRKGLSAAYGYWGALEPESAAQYLNEIPPNVDRDYAINGYISGLVHKDPETALIWAEEIQTKGLRESAMVRAGERFFRMNPQAASDWLEGATLSQSSVNRLQKVQQYHLRKQSSPSTE